MSNSNGKSLDLPYFNMVNVNIAKKVDLNMKRDKSCDAIINRKPISKIHNYKEKC